MLRKFKIKIDGKEYLVEMEEVGAPQPQAAPAPAPAAPAPAAAAPQPAPAPAAPAPAASGDGEPLTAPMPGSITKINVKVGDQVTENQPVMILEAMKMENEIVAPKAGTVTAIAVTKGDTVNSGDNLIFIQ
ncbi:acetyl-CoA carboxylase biotin carboxyl carrier protein subunit [Lacticaseibacillus baoqingensis]|uniref:Acetyl-CoA carboxylase biotin carboxyl carrier protein subunit n=1 Tax=Lacticaseibacillus baoqingensis TaxID=2486013 RepID=A0ABW4E9D7_9LACO|nr:acetyl-CoA carboxylase biotin carboxyl carrier protein subunit [Lacticaseibacillus baoqingensis]